MSPQNDDLRCEPELDMLKETYKKQSIFGKSKILRKIREIYNPSTTLLREPVVNNATRGRPSFKSQQQKATNFNPTPQDPSRSSYSNTSNFDGFDFSNLNQEPSRHSSYVNQTYFEDPLPKTNKSSHTNLIDEIPLIFRSYITHIYDVIGDGNCGFRSVAVCLGLHEESWPQIRVDLLTELFMHYTEYTNMFGVEEVQRLSKSIDLPKLGPAPFENWMIMPITGYLIASRYNVVVMFLSPRGSTICLPLWSSPQESQPHVICAIAHVHGNHFVKVELNGYYPIPPTEAQ